jgi:hypothetical protein
MINSDMNKVIIFSGRFQPMLRHHAEVFRDLQSKNPDADVYVATSDKTNDTDSPFTFEQKRKIISAHGIPADRVLSVRMPYNKEEYDQYFDENNTVLIFVVGDKDRARFPFSNTDPRTGLDMYVKDQSKPKYHQKYETLKSDPQSMKTRGYIMYAPTVSDDTGDIASASKFRSAIKAAPDTQSAMDIVVKQFGSFNQEVFDLIFSKIKGTNMKEHIEILKKLAGIVEAPVQMPDFEKGERPKTPKEREAYRAWKQAKSSGADPKIVAQAAGGGEAPETPSAKDAKDAAARPARAAASNPGTAIFTKIKPEDMKQDGKTIPSKQRKNSLANRFPADADINDPEVKKQMFVRVAARSPFMVFSEINARLGNDDNSLAVSDRLSDIVSEFANGKTLIQLSAEDRAFALKVLSNAIDNMELVKAGEADRVFDDPEDDEDEELKDSLNLDYIRSDYGVTEVKQTAWESKNAVADDLEIAEGSMKDIMHDDAERMSRKQFVSRYGADHGEFWDNIMGDIDDLEEALDPEQKQQLDDLISAYRDATDPEAYEYDVDPDDIIDQIRQEFGDKIADTVSQGPSMHYPRPGHVSGVYDPLADKSSPRVTKSGKINRQDAEFMKRNIKQQLGMNEAKPTDIKDLNKLSMDQLVKLRQQAETKSFNAGENSYHQAAKHFADQASKIQDLIDVKRKKEKARKEKEYMDDNVSMDEGINKTTNNAMEAALAELRKLAGI